jgi:hypothetical protein
VTKLSKEDATRYYNECFIKWQEWDKQCEEICKRFLWIQPAGEVRAFNPEVITMEVVKDWAKIDKELDKAKNELDKAFEQLYEAYH